MKSIIYLLLFAGTFFSCSKPALVTDPPIQGNWQLVDYYDGYVNGGHFKWNAVPVSYSHTITFNPGGAYHKTDLSDSSTCSGHYSFLPGSKLGIFTSCQLVMETVTISYIDKDILIIDRNVRDGKIRYRYITRP